MPMSDPRMTESARGASGAGGSEAGVRDAEPARASERQKDDGRHRAGRRQPRYVTWLNAALASLLLFAASPLARHWLMELVSTVCILGGIVAAPVVSMVAWIGLVLPTQALLHRMAPALVATSLIWFCMAIVGSHALRLDQSRGADENGGDGNKGGPEY